MNDSQKLKDDNYLGMSPFSPTPPPPTTTLLHLLLFNVNCSEMVDRKFRGSHITPFSANVVCVLYDCGSGAEGMP